MNYRHTHANGICTCSIIPPHILEAIARNGTPAERALAQQNLALDTQIRQRRTALSQARSGTGQGVGPPRKSRLIYTANNSWNLPGTLVRSEGQGPSGDVAINEAYDGLGATFDLYSNVYGRNSIDDNGMDLIGSVHVGNQWQNAQWDGSQMLFGDGDGIYFNRFTIAIDIMGHELTHGVTERTAGLEYHDQPGALNESISDVFGSLVKQRSHGQTAAQADWLIGAGIWAAGINGVALRSMKAPGTAYDDPRVGKDPQPDHMSRYDNTTRDNGGVHINSGIPNKAFYLAATALGGNAWDMAGNIWYRTLLDSRLSATAQFQDFANLTADNAGNLYGASARAAVVQAWHDVGVWVAPLQWSLASQSAGFGNLIDGHHPIWIADFTGVGHAQVMFYYSGDGSWWLGDMVGGQIQWSLASQSAGFGNLIDGQHPIWIADFTGVGHSQVMFYYSRDGNWWLGNLQRLQGSPLVEGPQGLQGSQVVRGPQGPQLVQVAQGAQVVRGPYGPQLVQGPQVVRGSQGPQLVQGPQGAQVVRVPQGPQLVRGSQGSVVVQGPQGPQLISGPSGIREGLEPTVPLLAGMGRQPDHRCSRTGPRVSL